MVIIIPHQSELHGSTHIQIWIGHNHIWIYMDKTIWECAQYVCYHEVLAPTSNKCKWLAPFIIPEN